MKPSLRKIVIMVLFVSFLEKIFADATKRCEFQTDAPVIEEVVPRFQHNIKFLDVQATVYRHALSTGSLPKIKILKYSATPLIKFDSDSHEILISTEESGCALSNSAAHMFKKSATAALIIASSFILSPGDGLYSGNAIISFLAGSYVMLNMKNVAFAADTSCAPAMEVVIEAPPYYLGSVAECKAEVENNDHCPDDFPTFATCSGYNPSCGVGVVGAGTGGLYTAMRLVDENKFSASDVCIFEATERVGGRLYSLRGFGPDHKLTVDAGGYRTWPEYTPTTHSLIKDYLGLNVGCYEDESLLDGPCERFNIVDDDGNKIGFASFVEEMMQKLVDGGACFFPRHELKSISHQPDGTNTLSFSNGATASNVPQLILNVPQRSLLKILRKSDIPFVDGVNEEQELFEAAHSVQSEVVTKLYLYYDDAWWYKLNLFNGDFDFPGDAQEMLLKGRYHDGHVECTSSNDCHGFLLAVYAHDFGGNKAQFFRRYQRDRPEPVTIISNTDTEGAAFLRHAHDRLKEYHLYNTENATYSGFEAQQVFDSSDEPSFAVLATWNPGTFAYGGGWHHWTDLSKVNKAVAPLNEYNIHVINEAFSKLQGWAEGSLLLADKVLEEHFSVQRPWDFDTPPDMVQRLAQTSSEECTLDEDGSGGGVSGSGGGGGGDGDSSGGGDDILCFTHDALVFMADGTMKAISDVKKGDYVRTGFADEGVGLVTEVLVHQTSNPTQEMRVGIISTPYGDLVGTPDHPIFVDGQWMELEDALLHESLFMDLKMEDNQSDKISPLSGSLEFLSVDYFFNLEIDGESPGSSHSYIVNGIIASGLGDNVELNEMFARQKKWKTEK